MLKGYRISKDKMPQAAAEIKPLTTDAKVAASLRQALSPQPNGDMIVYIEPTDAFAEIVRKYGEVV